MGRRLIAVAVLLLTATAGRAAAETLSIPVCHRLSVRIDPQSGSIEGTDHVRLLAQGMTPHVHRFTLAQGLRVDQLVVDGAAVAVDASAGRWDITLTGSDTHEITVRYRGVIAAAEGGDAALRIEPRGTFLTGDGWYPTFDTDVLLYELAVEVPAGQLAVAPGKLLSEKTTEQGYAARFASEGPTEEIVLFAGPYRMSERRHHGRRLRTYFPPDVADLAATYLDEVAHYIDFYEGWIGAYPYSMFSVVSGVQPLGLGFPGLTYIGAVVLRLPFMPATSLGHEVLHSWWGNGVLIDGRRGNWAEGLTTFMADYTYEERKGGEQARAMRLSWMREYVALPVQREQPLTAFRSRVHSASQVVGYHKAAMVFLMLRDEIGRDAFDRGIRRFWQRNRFGRAGWEDLQQAFEGSARRPLEAFFAQWVERAGAPMLELREAAVRRIGGSLVVSFVLAQREPVYQLRVPIVIRSERGVTTEAVRLNAPSRRYEIRTAYRPDGLCVDPDFRLFRRPQPGEVAPILRAVVFDTAASAVIAAKDADVHAAARAVALRLLEREPQLGNAEATLPDGPVLLIGTDSDVQAVLARQALEGPPARIAGRGTARTWAVQRPGKGTLVVISGRDAGALSDIAGPLPHYGGESFVVFDDRRAIDRGTWPAGSSPLCADLDEVSEDED